MTGKWQNQQMYQWWNSEHQNILVKHPEKHIDIGFVKETSTDKLVRSNQEMVTDVQTLIADFTDFKEICITGIR